MEIKRNKFAKEIYGTGDDSNVVLWFCLLAFCGAATVVVSKKRKEN